MATAAWGSGSSTFSCMGLGLEKPGEPGPVAGAVGMFGLFSKALPNMSPRPIRSAGTLLARCDAGLLARLTHEPDPRDKAPVAACGTKASAPEPPRSTAAAPAAITDDRTMQGAK